MGACGGVSLTVSGIEVQKGSQFQAARLVVQPISSPAVASSSSSSTSGSSSSSSSGRGRTSNSNSGGSGADVSKQSIVQTGPVPLPMQQQLWLDLPLGAGTIRNHVLRLRFSLGLTRAASAGAAKTEPVCLDSTLEVRMCVSVECEIYRNYSFDCFQELPPHFPFLKSSLTRFAFSLFTCVYALILYISLFLSACLLRLPSLRFYTASRCFSTSASQWPTFSAGCPFTAFRRRSRPFKCSSLTIRRLLPLRLR